MGQRGFSRKPDMLETLLEYGGMLFIACLFILSCYFSLSQIFKG